MAKLFYLLVILLFLPTFTFAQNINQLELLLEKVSFNGTPDFLELKNISNQSLNLQGLEFWDDKLFKEITSDFYIEPQAKLILTFNSSNADIPSEGKFFTDHKGLTATTEQLYIKQSQKILDFFCWVSEKPSQAELKEWEKNLYSQFWSNQNLENCFPSKDLKKSQSLLRISSERSATAWQTELLPEKTPIKKSTSKSSAKKTTDITLNNNQTPSKEILISEIFPAPDSKLSQTEEWIELFNPSENSLNLNGWYLDDQDGGSKPYQFGNIKLEAHSTILIGGKQSKLNLNNSNEQVRLFNSQQKLIDLLEYKKSLSGQSYSLISYKDAENSPILLWSEQSTPNQVNPQLNILEGEISLAAQFQTPYYFEIIDQNKSPIIIIFDEKTLPAALAKTVLIKDQSIKIQAFPIDSSTINNAPSQAIYQLHSLETDQQTPNEPEDFNLNLPILCVIIILALYLLQKKYQWIKLT